MKGTKAEKEKEVERLMKELMVGHISFQIDTDMVVLLSLKGTTFRVLQNKSLLGQKREGVQRADKRLEDCRGRDRRAEEAFECGKRHSEEERGLPH